MKVVWGYGHIVDKLTSSTYSGIGLDSPQQLLGLVFGALSCYYRFPRGRRVFYADSGVKKFLQKQLGRLDFTLFEEIIEVPFRQKLHIDRKVDFYALPKVYALTLQDEPFLILDPDVVVLTDFQKYDLTKPIGCLYSADVRELINEVHKSDLVRETMNRHPSIRKFFDWTHTLNAALFYHPDPVKASILGHTILDINAELPERDRRQIGTVAETFRMYEEALMPSIMEAIGSPIRQTFVSDEDYLQLPPKRVGTKKQVDFFFNRICKEFGEDLVKYVCFNVPGLASFRERYTKRSTVVI